MTAALAIALREFTAFFRLPVGWVVIALHTFLASVVVGLLVLEPGRPASMQAFFALSGWMLIPIAPAISMRLFSEELRAGTIEPLLTSPVSDAGIVLGKFLGATMFLGAMLAPTLVHAGVLWWASDPRPDPGPLFCGYLALTLVGLAYLSVGTLASALTSNQTLAFLATLFALLLFMLGAGVGAQHAPLWLAPTLNALAPAPRIADFARGVLDTSHVVYALSVTAMFLALAYAALAARRWR